MPPRAAAAGPLTLKRARSVAKSGSSCGIESPQLRLVWHGRTAQLTLNSAVTAGPDRVDVDSATASERLAGTPLRDITWWTNIQQTLDRREGHGCLGAGDAARLTSRFVDNVELPSALAFQLRYGNFGATGYLDLAPQFALRWMAPLLKPGVTRYSTPRDAAGYETMTYRLKPRGGGGLKIELESVEHNVKGQFTYDRHPTAQTLTLPDSARFLRYFFRTWKTTSDRRIALLAVKRRELLEPMTQRFEADPEKFCATVPAAEAVCVAVPNESILVPEVEVRTNGKPAWVPVGGTVADALARAKVKPAGTVPPSLTVERPWEGWTLPVEFDRSLPDIFRLVLIGGENIQWR